MLTLNLDDLTVETFVLGAAVPMPARAAASMESCGCPIDKPTSNPCLCTPLICTNIGSSCTMM